MPKDPFRIKLLDDGIWEIEQLRSVSSFYIEGTDRGLLIDTGVGIPGLRKLLEDKVSSVPYSVVATHGHMDHVGGAGEFDRIYMCGKDINSLKTCQLQLRKGYVLSSACALQGDPEWEKLADALEDISFPELVFIEEGYVFDLGGRTVTVYETPGHSPGSVSLFDDKTQSLFTGDLISRIVLLFDSTLDYRSRVEQWLTVVERISMLSPRHIYRGHGALLKVNLLGDLISAARGFLDGSIAVTHEERGDVISYGHARIQFGSTHADGKGVSELSDDAARDYLSGYVISSQKDESKPAV